MRVSAAGPGPWCCLDGPGGGRVVSQASDARLCGRSRPLCRLGGPGGGQEQQSQASDACLCGRSRPSLRAGQARQGTGRQSDLRRMSVRQVQGPASGGAAAGHRGRTAPAHGQARCVPRAPAKSQGAPPQPGMPRSPECLGAVVRPSLEPGGPAFEFQLSHLLAVCPQPRHLTLLCLGFSPCTVRMLAVPTSHGCCED